jgi:HlyD family secretion protein
MMSNNQQSIRRNLLVSGGLALTLVGTGGVWATTTELSGAVIAQGQLIVESNVKKVQHPTGGVVGELRVREGDHVNAGDIVLRLDETQTRANLAIYTKGLDEFNARKAREEAERDGADEIVFPDELTARIAEPSVERLLKGEEKLFRTRRAALEGKKSQLREKIAQAREEIVGYSSQVKGKENESHWIREELVGVRELFAKHLVQFTRLTALERDGARLEGERGYLIAAIAQANGKITETELQILQVDQDMRTEVGKDLADLRGKISEYEERKIAAMDQLKRIDLRAPQNGIVNQLDVHTVGGVVTPGQAVMSIVPDADVLNIEAKVQPQDIDQLRIGQAALLRFSAFNSRTTPELNGTIIFISPDVSTDQKTGAPFYVVRVRVSENEIARLEGLRLMAGMPVEAFFLTTKRTALSYVMRPFSDQLHRAFREK